MKHDMKKTVIILLLLCLAPFTFAEQFFTFGLGSHFFSESFPKDSYSRSQVGSTVLMSYYYFPSDFFLGVYAKTSMGSSTLLDEQNERESMRSRSSNVFDLRFALSPSFRLKLGPKFFIPLSVGPSLVYSNEKTTERLSFYNVKDYEYHSLSGGINGDIGMVFVPGKSFTLKPGIFFDYMFLRSEKGQMRMNYRVTDNAKFKGARYSAFNIGLYFTLGMKI